VKASDDGVNLVGTLICASIEIVDTEFTVHSPLWCKTLLALVIDETFARAIMMEFVRQQISILNAHVKIKGDLVARL
jgi:hypothetical protein